ncbi:hypothetical protein V6N12_039676 [Hibiscus sabdariffa]|uniref:RNase H type-1 domain-containing protein n=1 Tax=Hibiscus sabdariffa TaxID=183260 RepID=A0ABR2E1E9_9ROSI
MDHKSARARVGNIEGAAGIIGRYRKIFKQDERLASLGWVIRDADGFILAAECALAPHVPSSFAAEALAVKRGVKSAIDLGFRNVSKAEALVAPVPIQVNLHTCALGFGVLDMVLFPSGKHQMLHPVLNKLSNSAWKYWELFKAIHNLTELLGNVIFVNIFREANGIVDAMAKEGSF